jgi:redox-sensitive bicupin YhaK (pirin superfamily)
VILWDARLQKGAKARLPVPDGFSAAVFVRSGSLEVDGGQAADARDLAVFGRAGDGVLLSAKSDSEFLVLAGEPINEPLVAYGPFVMNTPEEIQAAMEDVQAGKLGRLD